MLKYILCISALLVFVSSRASNLSHTTIHYFSEELTFSYDSNIKTPDCSEVVPQQMIGFYGAMKESNYQSFLNELISTKQKLQLNDYLFFLLLRNTISNIWNEKSNAQKALYLWFFLSESGFDSRITYIGQQVFLNIFTEDEVFEAPLIEDKGRIFANLTDIFGKQKANKQLYLLEYTPKPQGKAFSFYLNKLPLLKPIVKAKTFRFSYRDKNYEIKVNTDETIINVMQQYPLVSESQYLEVPLSKTLSTSLLPQLSKLIVDIPEKEALELLVAFTRSSFLYQDDKLCFGKSKPMIADEVFHYKYSDCEDRSALFYTLVKELLDLPMIIIAYPDHLTIAVAAKLESSTAIRYQNKRYFICDPTGPVNSATIGEIPNGYEKTPFKIIGQHK